MTRSNARELAVHLIFSRSFTGQTPEQEIAQRLDKAYYTQLSEEIPVYAQYPGNTQKAYLNDVVCGVARQEQLLNEQIRKYSIGWDISRISRLARSIMQLAIFEILFVEDVPANVAVAEAVRLAKLYDGDDTGSFVNGILGSFVRGMGA